MKPILLAALAAIAVQPLVFLGWLALPALLMGETAPVMEMAVFSLFAAVFAIPFVLVIGIPSALLLRHHPHRGWWLAAIGFIAAALPLAATAPWGEWISGSGWDQPVVMHQLASMLTLGAHGLVGAIAFHWRWRALTPSSHAPPAKPSNVAVP
jgi:hypothetical protein